MKYPSIPQRIALALAAATLLGSAAAQADSADPSVRGKLEPPGCKLGLSNSGVADFGELRRKDLRSTGAAADKWFLLDVVIDCEVPRLVALRAQDNRLGSAVGGIDPNWVTSVFGLGLSAGRKTGEYTIWFGGTQVSKPDPVGDGKPLSPIMKQGSADSAGSWQYSVNGWSFNPSGGNLHAFMDKSSPTPLPRAYRKITAPLSLRAFLNKASELDLTRATPIDGSATLELVYL